MKFEHLFSPMQVGKVTYRNRIVSAPMAFGLIVQNPDARDFTYRKLEASAKGGNGCVIVGETDVNFTDAVRIPGFRPFDFAKPEEDPETFDAVGEYARRIKRHGAVALAELVHCGKEKVPFDPDTLAPASKQETVLIVGGGAAGMQAAITACDRGQKVILAEQGPCLGGLLRFTDVDTDKPDLMNFKNLLVREVERRDIDVRLNTVITPENITSFGADGVIFATGSLPSCPPVPGIGHAHKAMDMYDGKVKPGHKIVMVGGGLVGCEAGLFLQKTGHEVTVVELLGRLANESFGMYREALIWEMEKCGMAMLPKTRCLEITPTGVKVENAGGVQTLEADTVLFALGMKSVDIAPLKAAAEAAGLKTWVIGDAIQPGKVDQATRSAYLAGIEVGR